MKVSMLVVSGIISFALVSLVSIPVNISIFSSTIEDDSIGDLEKKLSDKEPGFKDFSKDTRLELAKIIAESIKTSTKLMRLNGQDLVQFSAFLTECGDKVNEGNHAIIPTCDSGVQKWIAEVGQFFADNEDDINKVIYPDALPYDLHVIQNVSQVIGDSSVIREQMQTGSNYTTYLEQISSACDKLFDSYDSIAYSICEPLVKQLNAHLKSYFENATSEINQVLGAGSGSKT